MRGMDETRARILREAQERARASEERSRRDRRELRNLIREAVDDGDGYGTVAIVLGVSKSRVQQVVKRQDVA